MFNLIVFVFVLDAVTLKPADYTKIWIGSYKEQKICRTVRDQYNKQNPDAWKSQQGSFAVYTKAECYKDTQS